MQLACPFCRRKPDHHTLSRYNPRAMALGGLKDALEDRRYYYAWCIECGFAKQAYERVCCNDGRLPPVRGFRCQECIQISERRVAELQAAEEAEMRVLGAQYAFRKDFRKTEPIRVTVCPSCDVPVEKVCFHQISLSCLYLLWHFFRALAVITSLASAGSIFATNAVQVSSGGRQTTVITIWQPSMAELSTQILLRMVN
jgi:hypothetical protein